MAPAILLGCIVIASGGVLIWVAVMSWQGRLQRNWAAGVRTPSTMRSDEAFLVANKAAAPYVAAGGVIMALGGVTAMIVPHRFLGLPIFGGVIVALAVALTGAAIGVRACR